MREETGNAISVSLMNRKIYAVISTEAEPVSAFHGALYLARRGFFETGRAAKVNEDGLYDGLPGTLLGKVRAHGVEWEKTVGGRVLETDFKDGTQRGVAYYAQNGVLLSRIYFDREQHWLRTEYFGPENSAKAKCSFKPDATRDAVLRFDYDDATGRTKETALFPVPYAFQTAKQSLQNAEFGDRFLLVADNTGEYLYCPKAEQEGRLAFLRDLENASRPYTTAWEIRDGEPVGAAEEPPAAPVFRDLETPAEQEALPEAEPQSDEAGEIPAAQETTAEEPEPLFDPDKTEEAPDFTLIRNGAETRYSGRLENGLRQGMGKTESADGLTLYQGEYKDDLRDGFGIHFYPSGAVSYVGMFREDRREGLGVSFREEDHALHVARWENGAPQDFVSLFSPEGTLQYAGRIVNGKRDGAGVSVRESDGAVLVEQYRDGEKTGECAVFAPDGALLYVGGWKDGRRCGRGTSFDGAGNVVYAGEWKDDRYTNGILYRRVGEDAKQG